MIAYGFTEKQILKSAEKSSVVVKNLREDGKGIRFTLGLKSERWRKWNYCYFRPEGRRGTGVCFHGHFAFMDWLFKFNNNGRIVSNWYGKWEYNSRRDFHEKAPQLANLDIGSMMYPSIYRESCKCERDHYEDPWVEKVLRWID
jgi:hypothetical protein